MGSLVDLSGKRFGRLTVISRAPNLKPGVTRWNCVCDCGNKTITTSVALYTGRSKSCGCLHRETAKNQGLASRKHGEVKTKLYRIWSNMKTRCQNQNNKNYKRWGARGIKVCDEWSNSFVAFRDWANSNGFKTTLSLDRIDNNKGYFPDNCRWVTAKAQARNTRKNRIIEYNGQRKCLSEWSEELGIHANTLINRLKHLSVEEAFSRPIYGTEEWKREKDRVVHKVETKK